MNAPTPTTLHLQHARIRCVCGVETLIVSPEPWYVGQEEAGVTPICGACARELGVTAIPVGAVHEVWSLAELPRSRAAALSAELVDEVERARTEPVGEPERPLRADAWVIPHEAPAAYIAWAAKQPAPARRAPLLDPIDLGVTAALVAVVALCAIV